MTYQKLTIVKWYKAPQEMLKAKRNDLKIFIFISIHYPLCWKRCVLAIGFKCLRNHPVLNGVRRLSIFVSPYSPYLQSDQKEIIISFLYICIMHMYLFVAPSSPCIKLESQKINFLQLHEKIMNFYIFSQSDFGLYSSENYDLYTRFKHITTRTTNMNGNL